MRSNKFIFRKIANSPLATRGICAFCTALLLMPLALPAQPSGGRDFAGFYSLTNVSVAGDQVRLTFTARVFNYSDSDVFGATVTVKGAGAPKGAYATFYSVNLPDREGVRLSQEISVPLREYQRWKMGRTPVLIVEYQASSGAAVRAVELSRGHLGEE